MKKRFYSIISLILLLSMLLSMFAIFASAEESSEDEEEEKIDVIYNRNFEEGWSLKNGATLTKKDNIIDLEYELTDTYYYNYYTRFGRENYKDGYMEVGISANSGGTIIEFDIKVDEQMDGGRIIYTRTTGGKSSERTFPNILYCSNNEFYFFNNKSVGFKSNGKWQHVAFVFDYSDEEYTAKNQIKCTVYYGDNQSHVFGWTYSGASKYIGMVRIGFPTGSSGQLGGSYCIDNLQIYTGTTTITDISDMGYGKKIDANAAKDVEILGSDAANDATYIKEGMFMKVGVENMLVGDQVKPIFDGTYGAPVKIDGKVFVPLQPILDLAGITEDQCYIHDDGDTMDIFTDNGTVSFGPGRDSVAINGKRHELAAAPGYLYDKNGENPYIAVCIDDVELLFPGWYVTYDNMGLVMITGKDNILSRETQLKDMLNIMKKFIYTFSTEEQLYEDVKEHSENFDHPYVIADSDSLDILRDLYNKKEESEYYNVRAYNYLRSYVNSAWSRYKDIAEPSSVGELGEKIYDEYVGIKQTKIPVNPYVNSGNGGYDVGGRLNESADYLGLMVAPAFAYQITQDLRYVKLAYDYLVYMGEWEHWGPGHFLNCADATADAATVYDLIYDGIVELGKTDSKYNVETIADIIYKHGVYHGVRSANGIAPPYYRKQGDASWYDTRENNWNAVCTSGMVLGSLAIMDMEEYRDDSAFLVINNLNSLTTYGLDIYAPDGAYKESPTYWSYGTNCFFKMTFALHNATGTEYGLLDTWGMDMTNYYAFNVQSSDLNNFNYNDGGRGSISPTHSLFVGQILGDDDLVAMRMGWLDNGQNWSMYDLLNYPWGETIGTDKEIALDYVSEGIDLYTARSSWEKGALFVGMCGGYNNVSHGHVDGGTFVYENAGRRWFCDFPSDDYNLHGFWTDGTRQRYYRHNAEGHNVICFASDSESLPFGQALTGTATISDYSSNEHGSYAVYDATKLYGSKSNYAKRGVMITNDRKTTVIQDDIVFKRMSNVYWFGHYEMGSVSKVTVSDDGKTAYMQAGKDTLRVSIVVKNPRTNYKFKIMDCYDFVLDKTFRMGQSQQEHGGSYELSRSSYKKLAIQIDSVVSLQMAVVIELIDPESPVNVGYKWTEMSDWNPYADTRTSTEDSAGEVITTNRRGKPSMSSIRTGTVGAERFLNDGSAYTGNLDFFYQYLADVKYASLTYTEDRLSDTMLEYYNKFVTFEQEYSEFADSINKTVETDRLLVYKLLGL